MDIEQLSEQEQLRRRSLAALRELGIDPYPARMFEVTATAGEIASHFDAEPDRFAEVSVAGRMMSRRIMGSASFFELQDHTGRIQVYVRRDDICPSDDPTLYNTVFKKLLDIGDFVGREGVHLPVSCYDFLSHFPVIFMNCIFRFSFPRQAIRRRAHTICGHPPSKGPSVRACSSC